MCLGIPGRIVRITDAERKLAMVDVGGVQREVNVACVIEDGGPVEDCIGYWVLVHVGFAMSERWWFERTVNELGEVQAEIESMRLSAAE